RARSGLGQVIDAAMVDGVALLTTLFYGLRAEHLWNDEPGTNTLDLGSPSYNVYETADGRYVSIGAGEPQFYLELLRRLGLEGDAAVADPAEPTKWAGGRDRFAAVFKSRTMAQWCELLEGADTSFAPVVSMAEAPRHGHHQARGTFVDVEGVVQPAPAPRFSRTPADDPGPPVTAGRDTTAVLAAWGFDRGEIDALLTGQA